MELNHVIVNYFYRLKKKMYFYASRETVNIFFLNALGTIQFYSYKLVILRVHWKFGKEL